MKRLKPETVRFNILMDKSLRDAIKSLAHAKGMNVSAFMRTTMIERLDAETAAEQKRRKEDDADAKQ